MSQTPLPDAYPFSVRAINSNGFNTFCTEQITNVTIAIYFDFIGIATAAGQIQLEAQ
jgi:hypothetical protein